MVHVRVHSRLMGYTARSASHSATFVTDSASNITLADFVAELQRVHLRAVDEYYSIRYIGSDGTLQSIGCDQALHRALQQAAASNSRQLRISATLLLPAQSPGEAGDKHQLPAEHNHDFRMSFDEEQCSGQRSCAVFLSVYASRCVGTYGHAISLQSSRSLLRK